MFAKVRDYYAEEVDFLVSCGESAHAILERLGVTGVALNRALYREGRNDLARLFGSKEFIPRGHGSCLDCATRIHTASKRCRDCEFVRRYGHRRPS